MACCQVEQWAIRLKNLPCWLHCWIIIWKSISGIPFTRNPSFFWHMPDCQLTISTEFVWRNFWRLLPFSSKHCTPEGNRWFQLNKMSHQSIWSSLVTSYGQSWRQSTDYNPLGHAPEETSYRHIIFRELVAMFLCYSLRQPCFLMSIDPDPYQNTNLVHSRPLKSTFLK